MERQSKASVVEFLDSLATTWDHYAILYFNAARHCLYCSGNCDRVLGIDPERRIEGKRCHIPPAVYRGMCLEVEQALLGEGFTSEGAVTVNGATKIIESTHIPHLAPDGKAQGVFILSRDITRQKETERSLREQEVTVKAVFDSASQAILAVNAQGVIQFLNRTTEQLFGYSSQEMIGQKVEMLIPAPLRAGHDAHRQAYFAAPHPRPMGSGKDLVGRRKDGTQFPVEVSLNYIGDPDSGTGLAIAFVADVSERTRAQERLRSLTGQLLTAQEEERRRIARELHDEVTQKLALLGMRIGLIRRSFPDASRELAAVQEGLIGLSEDVRLLSHEYHPGLLEHSGLAAALEAHCRELDALGRFEVRFEAREVPEAVPKAIEVILYRIALEALHNVDKHSGATTAWVELTGEPAADGTPMVTLSVADDGKGFLMEDVRNGSGLGLLGIEERARLVQGTLMISAQPGEGTRVSIKVPLPGAAPDASPGDPAAANPEPGT